MKIKSIFLTLSLLFSAHAFSWGILEDYEKEREFHLMRKIIKNKQVKFCLDISNNTNEEGLRKDFYLAMSVWQKMLKRERGAEFTIKEYNCRSEKHDLRIRTHTDRNNRHIAVHKIRNYYGKDESAILLSSVLSTSKHYAEKYDGINSKPSSEVSVIYNGKKSTLYAIWKNYIDKNSLLRTGIYDASFVYQFKSLEGHLSYGLTLTHELGHSFGLCDTYELMHDNCSAEYQGQNHPVSVMQTNAYMDLKADDIEGFLFLYDLEVKRVKEEIEYKKNNPSLLDRLFS